MKKVLLLLAFAAVACVACQKAPETVMEETVMTEEVVAVSTATVPAK